MRWLNDAGGNFELEGVAGRIVIASSEFGFGGGFLRISIAIERRRRNRDARDSGGCRRAAGYWSVGDRIGSGSGGSISGGGGDAERESFDGVVERRRELVVCEPRRTTISKPAAARKRTVSLARPATEVFDSDGCDV